MNSFLYDSIPYRKNALPPSHRLPKPKAIVRLVRRAIPKLPLTILGLLTFLSLLLNAMCWKALKDNLHEARENTRAMYDGTIEHDRSIKEERNKEFAIRQTELDVKSVEIDRREKQLEFRIHLFQDILQSSEAGAQGRLSQSATMEVIEKVLNKP